MNWEDTPLSIRAVNLLTRAGPSGSGNWTEQEWKEHAITLGEKMLRRIPGLGRTSAQEILEWAMIGQEPKFEIEIDPLGDSIRVICQFPGIEKRAGMVVPLGDFLMKYALELSPFGAANFVAALRDAAELAELRAKRISLSEEPKTK